MRDEPKPYPTHDMITVTEEMYEYLAKEIVKASRSMYYDEDNNRMYRRVEGDFNVVIGGVTYPLTYEVYFECEAWEDTFGAPEVQDAYLCLVGEDNDCIDVEGFSGDTLMQYV